MKGFRYRQPLRGVAYRFQALGLQISGFGAQSL